MKKSVLIIGSGGREHALGWKLKQSSHVGKIYFAPGNAGTATLGKNIAISPLEIGKLLVFALQNNIDLTVVGGDDPLAAGVVNRFQEKKLAIFGPTQQAAEIEWSKAFAKTLMKTAHIPTAKFRSFTSYAKALEYIKKQHLPLVIKASGLALGKGVMIVHSIESAQKNLKDIMIKKIFGTAGTEVIIEEFLEGHEVSLHAFTDGSNTQIFPISKDHKAIFEDNKGPNTGGMGTIAPVPWIKTDQVKEMKQQTLFPMIEKLKKDNREFKGVIYPGLMITKFGPKVLEVNSRFGDPETQSYMRLLKTDLYEILMACAKGNLSSIKVEWDNTFACTIILASKGYPGVYSKGDVITGIKKAEKDTDIVVFHSGTKVLNDTLVTNGGRVLGVSAIGKTLDEALKKAYIAVDKIHFEGKQYRKDIGKLYESL